MCSSLLGSALLRLDSEAWAVHCAEVEQRLCGATGLTARNTKMGDSVMDASSKVLLTSRNFLDVFKVRAIEVANQECEEVMTYGIDEERLGSLRAAFQSVAESVYRHVEANTAVWSSVPSAVVEDCSKRESGERTSSAHGGDDEGKENHSNVRLTEDDREAAVDCARQACSDPGGEVHGDVDRHTSPASRLEEEVQALERDVEEKAARLRAIQKDLMSNFAQRLYSRMQLMRPQPVDGDSIRERAANTGENPVEGDNQRSSKSTAQAVKVQGKLPNNNLGDQDADGRSTAHLAKKRKLLQDGLERRVEELQAGAMVLKESFVQANACLAREETVVQAIQMAGILQDK
ncbi:hypothetical protein CBR_g18776 [Chara braunii]|uniref:Uncharacterized protein n=1 Tax=Chara braunii TaxID=69332 RepID=A0A388KWB8_CHABU|nr:hypothetical protein CBR_g18776 [Chara braunii]|eukprot:GBG74365.1 hypothetical protein CBR_g18776 [Chara braunii]